MAICTRIRDIRLSLNLTQARMAEVIGVNISTMKAIEQYNQLPTIPHLRVIAEKFHVSYDFLIDGK